MLTLSLLYAEYLVALCLPLSMKQQGMQDTPWLSFGRKGPLIKKKKKEVENCCVKALLPKHK